MSKTKDDNLKSRLLFSVGYVGHYGIVVAVLTDARLSVFKYFWGDIVILRIAQGIREMHRCHHPTLLSITSVIVPSSLSLCDSSWEREREREEGFYVQSEKKSFGLFTDGKIWQLFLKTRL